MGVSTRRRLGHGLGKGVILTRRVLVGLAVVLMASDAVRADVTPLRAVTPLSQGLHTASGAIAHSRAAVTPTLDDLDWLSDDASSWLWGQRLPDKLSPSADSASRQPPAQTLPPSPSSLALGLTALAGFGVYQAGRSIRKLHLSALPEWYHTGGPTQVGHATPFDLAYGSLVACCFEGPVPARPAIVRHTSRGQCPRLRIEAFLRLAAPRGPPVLS